MTLLDYLNTPKGCFLLAGMLFLLLMSNACHEFGHALGAWMGGDRRADLRKRITLNPINHAHWLLTLVIPVLTLWLSNGTMLFGGAKPVMVDRARLSRWGMLRTALMGPLGNFLFAGLLILVVSFCMHQNLFGLSRFDWVRSDFWKVMQWPLWFSIALGLLNLLPIPPLDGGHVVACFLPTKWQHWWYLLAPIGILLLIGYMLYLNGVLVDMGLHPPPPSENPFMWVNAKAKAWVHAMMPFWDTVL